jgi:transposase
MRAKTEQRDRARALRLQGKTYDQIVEELGVSKSSVSLWVRDLPRRERTAEELKQHTDMMRAVRDDNIRRRIERNHGES